MSIANPAQTLANNIYVAGFQDRLFAPKLVVSRDFGFNKLSQLAMMMGPSISVSKPKVEVASLGNIQVFSPVSAAPAANGSFLDVTVASGRGFRVGDIVEDKDHIQGRVESVSGNVITLSSLATTLTTSHFTTASTAKVIFDATANYSSDPKAGINYIPEDDYTYLAVQREGAQQFRRDRQTSNVLWTEGGGFWYHSWVDLTVRRYSNLQEMRYAYSVRGAYNVGAADEYYQTEGLRDAILRNGQYFPSSSQMTLNDLNDIIEIMAARNAGSGSVLTWLMGKNILGRLQQLIGTQYLTYTGQANTFGGVAVQGIDIYKYNYLGMELQFATWDLLDHPRYASELSSVTGRPKSSSSIYMLNLAPLPAVNGSGMVSPIQRYHFNDNELIAGYVPGMLGLNDSTPSQLREAIAGMNPSLIVNPSDSVDFQMLSDSGVKFHADNFGLFELTA